MNSEQECRAEERKPETQENILFGILSKEPAIPQEIIIIRIENGFNIRIGCKVFCFSEWVSASEALALWFKNPEEAQKKYCRCEK